MSTRVVHMSDIHFTADPRNLRWRELVGKRLSGWVNLRFVGRYRQFAETRRVCEAFIRDLDEVEPDFIVFSGDVTGMSLPSEFQEAREALDPLVHLPNVLGIPGNHDVYTERAHHARPFSRYFGAWERSDLPEVAAALSRPYPIVRFVDERVAVVAINVSVPRNVWDSSGVAGPAQLEALGRALDHPRVRERRTLVVCHYAPRRHSGEEDSRFHGLRDAEHLLETAARGGAAAILHGHLHRRFIHLKGPVTPVPLLCTGSLTDSRRNRSYHVYEITDDAIEVAVRGYDAAAERFDFVATPVPGGAGPIRIELERRAGTAEATRGA